jgi:hypothetical protein
LLTASRDPKLPFETLRAITTMPAVSVPHEQIDNARRKARKAAEDVEPIE